MSDNETYSRNILRHLEKTLFETKPATKEKPASAGFFFVVLPALYQKVML